MAAPHGADASLRTRPGLVVAAAGLVAFLVIVHVFLSFLIWGAVDGLIASLIIVSYAVLPTWVLLSFTHMRGWWTPTAARRLVVMVALVIGGVLAGMLLAARDVWVGDPAGLVIGGLIGLGLGVPVVLAMTAITWTIRSEDAPFLESTGARGVVLSIFGVVGGLSALFLIFFTPVIWGEVQFAINYSDARPFEREMALAEGLHLPAALLGTHFPAVWALGFASSGFLLLGHARARGRRRQSLDLLKGRMEDHFAARRLSEVTYEALRSSIMTEQRGPVPGETEFIHARAAIVRIVLLGALGLLVVVLAAYGMAGHEELSPPASPEPTAGAPFAPCYACTDAGQYAAYVDKIQDWTVWAAVLLLAMGVASLFPFLMVSHLVSRIRAARAEAEAFWTDRQALEDRMLREVRAATPAPTNAP